MISDSSPSGCGYCKDKRTNIRPQTSYKYFLYLKSLPVDIYNELTRKGWTRCGNLIYKTNYEKTCCKLYQPRININNFKITKEQKKIMKRFRKFLSGEYELNKQNKYNLQSNTKKQKKINTTIDYYQSKINQKVQQYIKSKLYINTLQKYNLNRNLLQIILNKIKDTKIRINNNKKNNFDYSCDFIFIISKILKSVNKKEKNNKLNRINTQNDDSKYKYLMNEIYNNFITYYKPIDEIVTFNEKTGHINFKIKNRNEYEKLINSMKNMNISNNSKNKIDNPLKSNTFNNKNNLNRPSSKTNQNVQFNAINTYKNNNLQNNIHYGLIDNNNLINMNNRNNINNNNNQKYIYNSIQFKYNNYTPNNISSNNIYNQNNIYNNNIFNQNNVYNSNIYNRNNINNQISKYNINSSYNLNNQYNINNNVNNNKIKNKFKNKKKIINKNPQDVNKIKYFF